MAATPFPLLRPFDKVSECDFDCQETGLRSNRMDVSDEEYVCANTYRVQIPEHHVNAVYGCCFGTRLHLYAIYRFPSFTLSFGRGVNKMNKNQLKT